MNKNGVIVIILGVIILALVIGGVMYDNSIDTSILTINGTKYDKADFQKFIALTVFEKEAGATIDEASAIDKQKLVKEAYDSYVAINEYYMIAKSKGVTLSEDDKKYLEDTYNNETTDRERLTELGISKEDYIAMYEKAMVSQQFVENISNYYTLPEGTYDQYIEQNPTAKKTYEYRIMQISIPKDEETGVAKTEETRAKAEEALGKVKAGENFEETSKTYGSYRMVTKDGEYTLVNGELESAPAVFLSDSITNEKLYNEVVNTAVGEYTKIIEEEDSFMFAYVEAIKDELDESGKKQIEDTLTSSYAGQIISSEVEVIRNEVAVKKMQCPDLKVKVPVENSETTNPDSTTPENTEEVPEVPAATQAE